MELYWNLHGLLLDENRATGSGELLRQLLKISIIQLYQKVLLVQMKSVCAYSRSTVKRLGRDFLKLDDWESELESVQSAEDEVDKCSQRFNTEEARTRQGLLLNKLDGIQYAIQNQQNQLETIQQEKEDQKCLQSLFLTDPRSDKKRIESAKGGLLPGAYNWILDHEHFEHWRHDDDCRLLWIKGGPGKGKTMLMCGIINELQESNSTGDVTFVFCQETDERLNNKTAILRGLIHMLATQQPRLIKYIRAKYDQRGKSVFEDVNARVSLIEILDEMLQSPELEDTVLMVDALDECTSDLSRLLDFIVQALPRSTRVKWILSSRNYKNIEGHLQRATHAAHIDLELNEHSTTQAIHVYIHHQVGWLQQLKGYKPELRAKVQDYLLEKAGGTFLWVALVCQELSKDRVTARSTEAKLIKYPPGLDPLYTRMLEFVDDSDDSRFCRRALAIMSVVYRPLSLHELLALDELLEEELDLDDLREVVANCGSFLATREYTVSFVHQSAKDFLRQRADIFPFEGDVEHQNLGLRSLKLLKMTLRRNIYSIDPEDGMINDIIIPSPDPLATVRYSCLYWAKHLIDGMRLRPQSSEVLQLFEPLNTFLSTNFLHWLEAMSLLEAIPEAIQLLVQLDARIQVRLSVAPLPVTCMYQAHTNSLSRHRQHHRS